MIFAGDVVPGDRRGRIELGTGVLLCNLEAPVLGDSQPAPARKAGPALCSVELPAASTRTIATLANNHMMDFGEAGLLATRAALGRRDWGALGAGSDDESARAPLTVEDQGRRVGLIACCEAQFGVAGPGRAGVAEVGPWVYRTIDRLRAEVDAVVVSMHAALELSPWPSPRLQALYRSFIDAGATVVHGHHAHVPQGWEEYGGGLILYGLGNFLVNPEPWRALPNTLWSLVAAVSWEDGPVRPRILVGSIEDLGGELRASASTDPPPPAIAQYVGECNRPLADSLLLAGVYQESAMRVFRQHYAGYLDWRGGARPAAWRDRARRLKRALAMGWDSLTGWGSSPGRVRDQALLRYHLFACLSHREAIAEALGILGGELPDRRTAETRRLADALMPWSAGAAQG